MCEGDQRVSSEIHQDYIDETQKNEDPDSGWGGPSQFGDWLRQTRHEKQWSASMLANESGVSLPQIYNIETGRSLNPQKSTRDKLARALGSEISDKVIEETEKSGHVENVGDFIDFDPHSETDLPDEPGIYVFYDISERPVYVGQSDNIKRRIKNDHFTRFWYKSPIVQAASYISIEDVGLRVKIEKVMIQFMKSNAVINKNHVSRN